MFETLFHCMKPVYEYLPEDDKDLLNWICTVDNVTVWLSIVL